MTVVAPDYVRPVVGWRTWLVVQENGALRLRSVAFKTVWQPCRELTARCEQGRRFRWRLRRKAPHDAPSASCQCGIYAVPDVVQLSSYLTLYDDPFCSSVVHRVFGQVSLWGSVVEAESGWRASHAYPARIFVPAHAASGCLIDPVLALELGEYGVPVEILGDGTRADTQRMLTEIAMLVAE